MRCCFATLRWKYYLKWRIFFLKIYRINSNHVKWFFICFSYSYAIIKMKYYLRLAYCSYSVSARHFESKVSLQHSTTSMFGWLGLVWNFFLWLMGTEMCIVMQLKFAVWRFIEKFLWFYRHFNVYLNLTGTKSG